MQTSHLVTIQTLHDQHFVLVRSCINGLASVLQLTHSVVSRLQIMWFVFKQVCCALTGRTGVLSDVEDIILQEWGKCQRGDLLFRMQATNRMHHHASDICSKVSFACIQSCTGSSSRSMPMPMRNMCQQKCYCRQYCRQAPTIALRSRCGVARHQKASALHPPISSMVSLRPHCWP